jgi:excinuclease ABC subunit C
MERFIFFPKDNVEKLPRTPGIYAFKNNREILYIGKAANLKERAKNHFQQPSYRDNLFLDKIKKIGILKTDSEIEALLLEAELIKKYQPRYNIMWRDDKNYFYVAINKGKIPFVIITHQPGIKSKIKNQKLKIEYIGPFVDGTSLKKVLKLLRKVFPYYSAKNHPKKLCLWCHLKLCPGPNPNLKEYKKDIKNLAAVLKGERQSVLKNLRKEMKNASISQNFEKAAKTRDQISALEKIIAHAKVIEPTTSSVGWAETKALLKKISISRQDISRIEGYDVSNIQGQKATGSMVVFSNGSPDKNSYRKFKVKISGKPNDTAMISEIIKRRLSHPEWPLPELMLIDGGKGQINAALEIKNQHKSVKSASIRVLALAKRKNELFVEGKKQPILLKTLPREIFNIILQIRDESHRFAIAYHHKLRDLDLDSKTC